MSGRTPQERREQVVALAKGDKGERGEQGEQGASGEQMSPRLRRSLVYLFAAAVLLAVLALVAEIHGQAASDAAQQAAQRHEQAAQRRAGLKLERQLCTTFGKAAALKPPAGNPHMNPSRAYLQGQHTVWVEIIADLRCNRLPRK